MEDENQFDDISESDLDALINDNPSEHDEQDNGDDNEQGTETESDVSPNAETEEEPEAEDDEADDGQNKSSDEEESDEDATDEEKPKDESEEGTEGEDDSSEDNQEDDKEKESDSEAQKFQPLKADGQEYHIDNIQELYTLASKGVKFVKSMQQIAPHRRGIMSAEKNGVSLEDSVDLMVNMKESPKDTILALMKEHGVDPLEVDMDVVKDNRKTFTPSDFEVDLKEVTDRIQNNERYSETVELVRDKWDDKSRQEFYKNPSLLEMLNNDMQVNPDTKTSAFDVISPVANKMKMLDGGAKSDLQYYALAVNQLNSEKAVIDEKAKTAKETEKILADKKKADIDKKKKAAGVTKADNTKSEAPLDFDSMSDAELDAILNKTN